MRLDLTEHDGGFALFQLCLQLTLTDTCTDIGGDDPQGCHQCDDINEAKEVFGDQSALPPAYTGSQCVYQHSNQYQHESNHDKPQFRLFLLETQTAAHEKNGTRYRQSGHPE